MAAKLIKLELTKAFGSNMPGDIASFPEDVALHIIKNNGGDRVEEALEEPAKKADAKK